MGRGASDNVKLQSKSEIVAPKKEPIRLIEGERSKNIEIILTKLKVPNINLCDALRTCAGKYSTSSVLESVEKILPTEEE